MTRRSTRTPGRSPAPLRGPVPRTDRASRPAHRSAAGLPRAAETGTAAVLLALLLLAGCAERDAGPGGATIEDSTYVEVMARLVVVDSTFREPSDDLSMTRDSARELILRAHDVRPEELLDFAERIGPDAERMRAVWEHIRALTDTLETGGWTPDSLP